MASIGLSRGRRRDVDMTQGNIVKHLITFALPLLAGNIFQQMYNMVDTWVGGNFVSNEAFSAVGSVGPIVNMLIGLFMGLSSGAGAVISQYYGAKKMDRAKEGVKESLKLSVIITAALAVLMIVCKRPLLRLISPEADVIEFGAYFVTVISPFYIMICFNQIYAGALRGAGDAKAPMVIMLFSFVLFRQIYLAVGTQFPALNNPWFVGLGYPAGWIMCSSLQLLYFYKSKWRERCRASWAAEDAAKELKSV